ncbi:unnamed protein product [Lathyrus sativus]|nr:unnamed protein product [Lathyrus sativus]
MDSIKVLASNSIKAPISSYHKIDLTPWDLQFLPSCINKKGLLYNHSLGDNQIQELKHSLSSALAIFPPFAGRLEITQHKDNTVSCCIICNNEGVLFIHAAAENTCVTDILESTYVPPIVHSFFPLNGVRNCEGTSNPLLAVQVTELVDGVFIGFTFNHVVADGKSMWHFINSWAEISRSHCHPHQISKVPTFERWFPKDIQLPIRFPFTMEPQDNPSDRLSFVLSHNEKRLMERIFHFTKDKIAQLKFEANTKIGSTNKISSLQALLTHLWCCVTRAKKFEPHEEVHSIFIIGVRPRFVPPLEEYYFGNAIISSVVTMKSGELLEGGLAKGALEINKKIASHSDISLKNQYESWLINPRLINIESMLYNNFLLIGSSPRFDVYDNDFGWGKPVATRTEKKINGYVSVYMGIEEGSVDLQVCLPYEILEAMGNDHEFMKYV